MGYDARFGSCRVGASFLEKGFAFVARRSCYCGFVLVFVVVAVVVVSVCFSVCHHSSDAISMNRSTLLQWFQLFTQILHFLNCSMFSDAIL